MFGDSDLTIDSNRNYLRLEFGFFSDVFDRVFAESTSGARIATGSKRSSSISAPGTVCAMLAYVFGARSGARPNGENALGMRPIDDSTLGKATFVVAPAESMVDSSGYTQAGFLAAFLGAAMASAVSTFFRGTESAIENATMKVSFILPAPFAEDLTCEGWVVDKGSQIVFVEAELRDSARRLVAKSDASFVLTEPSHREAMASRPT